MQRWRRFQRTLPTLRARARTDQGARPYGAQSVYASEADCLRTTMRGAVDHPIGTYTHC